jgi:SNF2 family DNA or RNA helicase
VSYTIERSPSAKASFVRAKLQLDHDGHNFLLTTPFGINKDRLKKEVQVEWDPKRKLWVLPDLVLYANSALEIFPEMPLTKAAHARLTRNDSDSNDPLEAFFEDSPQDAKLYAVYCKLYPFQQELMFRLVVSPKRNQQGVLSPGLGKTVVSLLAARLLGAKSVLIVCIKDLMRQWQDEEEKWFGERTLIRAHGTEPGYHAPSDRHGWFVANYDTVVGRLHDSYQIRHWDVVIIDESVLVKNRKTRRFKRLLDLRFKDVDRFWELSGSPSTRYKDDLWAQMKLLYPEDFRSYWRFAERFCVTEQNPWSGGQVITDDREDRDTKEDLRDLQFVRNQKDVLKDLPEEIPVLVPVELTSDQRKAYQEMSSKFVAELESGEKVWASKGRNQIVLSQLIRLQQITSNLINLGGADESIKANALLDMLEARSFEFPAIVWVNWVPGAQALLKRIRSQHPDLRSDWIHGAESKRDEVHNEVTFQDYKAGKIDVLILALTVGRFGHNLQNTRTVIYYDKQWDADAFVQSLHRVKRIGLDHKPVIVTLKAINTTDEMIEQNLAGKLPSISSISNSDLASMLRALTGEAV